jgi:hypothetical protein
MSTFNEIFEIFFIGGSLAGHKRYEEGSETTIVFQQTSQKSCSPLQTTAIKAT